MTIRAAGGVVWCEREGQTLVALVHRPRHDDWSLPKGKLDDGEDEVSAALREVQEEIGAVVDLGADLGTIQYHVRKAGRTSAKTVRYWAMRYQGGTFSPNDEVDAVEWLALAAAARRLTYPRDRRVLARFAAHLEP